MSDRVFVFGDKGQRYEVHATDVETGDLILVGRTNAKDGGGVMATAILHPLLKDPKVVDRFPGFEKLTDPSKFAAGCRKCVSDVYAGREACRYCNYVFPRPAPLT